MTKLPVMLLLRVGDTVVLMLHFLLLAMSLAGLAPAVLSESFTSSFVHWAERCLANTPAMLNLVLEK